MTKEFVPYEQALALKELGFNEKGFMSYDKEGHLGYVMDAERFYKYSEDPLAITPIWAPTYSQAFRWFRIQHGLYSAIVPKKSWPDNFVSGIEWYVEICGGDGKEIGPDGTYSYEEAEQACLDKLILICKNK